MKKIMYVMLGVWAFGMAPSARAEEGAAERRIADKVAKLVTAARPVVSTWQDRINNPGLGDKGFTPELFSTEARKSAIENFSIDPEDPKEPEEVRAMWQAMKNVVRRAQPVINKKGLGFKGFLPAVFARQAAAEWAVKVPGAYAKLTTVAPLHNKVNTPDEWERTILTKYRTNPDYNNRNATSEVTKLRGRKVLRLIQPEYLAGSCMACHGGPKGEKMPGNPSPGIKCGEKEGAGGSGFSIALPIK